MQTPIRGLRRELVVSVILLATVCLVLAFAPIQTYALTQVDGTITVDTRWSLSGSPYVIQSGVTISSGATLTIDPGVIIKMAPGASINIQGSLVAQGTDTQYIYFTSYRDDSIGGDTNGDGGATTPTVHEWAGDTSGTVLLDHVVMSYGYPELNITGGSVDIANSTLTQSISNIEQSGGTLVTRDSSLENGAFQQLLVSGGSASLYRTKLSGGLASVRQSGGSLALEAVNFITGILRIDGQATTTTVKTSRVGSINANNGTIVNARNSWWGQVSGPSGSQISGNVQYIPVLTNDPKLGIDASSLANQLINQDYLWGGKGWDFANKLFTTTNVVKTGYRYWNPDTKGFSIGNGVDCSGLVAWSYNRNVDPNKYFTSNFIKYESADGQYKKNAQSIAESQLQPGDLLFFDWGTYSSTSGWNGIKDGRIDHVAVYIGGNVNSNIVHAQNEITDIHTASLSSLRNLSGFVGFSRPKNATIAMSITKHSPIHLTVTDPDGSTVSDSTGIATDEEFIRESGDLVYATTGEDANGYPEDVVYSHVLKQGVYRIEVTPFASTTPDQTYSLEFTAGSTTIALAQGVPLSQIPSNGYSVVVGADNSVTVDTAPPTTTLTASGTQGQNGWYTSNITITFSATDTGSGVARTYFSLDGAATSTGTSTTITTEGIHTISYYSIDNAGNQEQATTTIIKIDKTPPEVQIGFNTAQNKIIPIGIDNLSATTIATTSNSITITDEAGHFITVHVTNNTSTTITAALTFSTLTYSTGTTTTANTYLNHSWSQYGTGYSQFSTGISTPTGSASASYSAYSNQTWVSLYQNGQSSVNVYTGLYIPVVRTNQGNVIIH